jgi:hypothetical protein
LFAIISGVGGVLAQPASQSARPAAIASRTPDLPQIPVIIRFYTRDCLEVSSLP